MDGAAFLRRQAKHWKNKEIKMSNEENMPSFRVIKGKSWKDHKVILQCSKCEKDIREMSRTESIDPRKGYYCSECDDGTIHLNLPTGDSK